MHARNIYRDGIDFAQLSAVYPPLKKYLLEVSNIRQTIDFKDQNAQRCLTEALLYRDFKLEIQLPPDRLCPPVPNRLNYILWLQDINSASRYMDQYNPHSVVQGVDIGTGASAIYPLLACALEKTWKFLVSEIDPFSFQTAKQNISANKLEDRIRIVQSDVTSPILLPLFLDKDRRFDFTMCNPPFYSSLEEVTQSAEAKQYGPNAVCTGAEVEMITSGGESAFVGKMVVESLIIREGCRWYTSMLGKLSSIVEVVDILKSNSIDNYLVTEFVQGKTRRWAIGWSFSDIRLPDPISRISDSNPTISKYMPAHNTILQPVSSLSTDYLYETLSSVLSSIGHIHIRAMKETDLDPSAGFLVFAQEDTWSRRARRRQKRLLDDSESNFPSPSLSTLATSERDASSRMACSIHIREPPVVDTNYPSGHVAGKPILPAVRMNRDFVVEFTWRKGRDRGLFDGFCSHVSRKIAG